MNDGAPLFEGESVLCALRKHGVTFAYRVIGFAVLGAFPFLAWFLLHTSLSGADIPLVRNTVLFASIIWLCFLWVATFYFWTIYRLERWFVTDRRLVTIEHAGLFARTVKSFALEDIDHVETSSAGALHSMFGYGDIEIIWKDNSYYTLTDIPAPERVEAAIQESHLRMHNMEEAARKQQETLRLVAHEVKGHLARNAAVLSSIVSGDFGEISAPLKDIADRALTGTKAGVGEVMDILSTEGDAAAHVNLNKEPFDLRIEVRAIVEREKPIAQDKGLTLEFIEDPRPCIIMGDKQTMRERVIRNLVENAINYTQQGSVTVGVSTAETSVVCWVHDTGVGISPKDMPRLFTQGGHGEHSQEVNPNSTGFGLFAAKQVVQAHGGEIWAESDGVGTGAKFFVAIPAVNNA